jgi:hypothetical protein
MLPYVKTWHKEHAQILEALLQVRILDVFRRAGQMKLQELRRILETHLKNEDRDFYPILKRAAETDAGLRRELFLFASDMERISAEIGAFFCKQKSDPMGKDIPAEFGKISAMIKSRISREENLLIKEFEKLADSPVNREGVL